MRRSLHLALQHPGRVAGFGLAVLLLFISVTTFVEPSGFSIPSLGRSIDTTLTLMLAIDSPSKMLQNHSPLLVTFGWLVCLMGWLFLPLVLGTLVDISLSRAEAYSKLRALFRELGIASQLDGAKLEAFVDEMMREAARIVAAKRKL